MIVTLLGGLGVFLLGMLLLTDGLKAVAGDALRHILTRYVATPLSGVGWGALVTTLVQSSTATTLTTVGFVSAGLLTFKQAVGVIFGANLGTTSTGWIVSQLGFKVSLGSLSPPLILLGVAMRLMLKGRAMHAGTAIAGFALLFMGIDLLQNGMGALASRLSPGDLPGGAGTAGEWGSRLVLVGFGFLMTVIMQSSSASMTTTLAAVASGTIGLEQAAALAIGQNIGTTPTAVVAALGAPAPAKRTAAAHVLFNTFTAAVAVVILPQMLRVCERAAQVVGADDAPTTLALFHTVFNFLGVLILMPVIGPFARLIERMFPERGLRSTRYLTPSVATVGPVALEAARRALVHVLGDASALLVGALGRTVSRPLPATALTDARTGLQSIVRFVHSLGHAAQGAGELKQEQALLHASDHLDRLIDALARSREVSNHPESPEADPSAARAREDVAEIAEKLASLLRQDGGSATPVTEDPTPLADEAERVSRGLAELRRVQRCESLRMAAAGELDPDLAMRRIDLLLWLDGAAYHLWRATTYLRANPVAPDVHARPGATTEHEQRGGNGDSL